jgi:enoyl-CoA hydratase
MPDPDVLVNDDDAVLEVIFNRPAKCNALNAAILDGLAEAVERFQREERLRVLLIRGTGKYFCSGMDITTLQGDVPGEVPSTFRSRYRRSARHDLWDALETVEKPVVVGHNGVCLGAGLELSLSCDFRVASDQAAYGLPEMDLGMIPGSGGTSRLVRMVGPHWARWLVMAGERVSAEQALMMGLTHVVWPAAEFDAQLRRFCARLAARPPEATAAAKLAIELTMDLDKGQGRHVERLINSSLAGGEEQRRVFADLRRRFTNKP